MFLFRFHDKNNVHHSLINQNKIVEDTHLIIDKKLNCNHLIIYKTDTKPSIMIIRTLLSLLFVVFILSSSNAQTHYQLSAQGFFSNNQRNTFWSQANQLGIVPTETTAGLATIQLHADYRDDSTKASSNVVKWGYGISAAGIVSSKGTNLLLPLAYLKVKIVNLELEAGRFIQTTSITGDHVLSAGSFSSSTNALPTPGVRVGIHQFKALPFTKGLVSVKGFYAENYVGDNFIRYHRLGEVHNVMLHRKHLAIRYGKPEDSFNMTVSGNHQVMWGGNLVNPSNEMINSSLGTYKNAILGRSAANLMIGDHIGSLDIALQYNDYGWKYTVYRQNFFEGNGINKGITWNDGLNGIEMQRNSAKPTTSFHVNSALLEFIHTTNQIDYSDSFQMGQGMQAISYYNQTFYGNGWSYKNRTMGNPLLANKSLIKQEHLGANQDYLTPNNRILALHSGAKGMIAKFPWMVKATYSLNSGTYTNPYTPKLHQFSFLVNAEAPLKKLWDSHLFVAVSGDIGELYHRTLCLNLGLYKKGLL